MTSSHAIDRLFRPQSVAIIGASPVQGNPRNTLLRILIKYGFEGRVYPVTPTHPQVENYTTYKTVAELPEVPDVALIITPAKTVPSILEECGQKGIRNAIVFSAGFEEISEGKELAQELAVTAQRHGITLVGPNCQGIWSTQAKTMLTYSPAALSMEDVAHEPIAIISQSGALGGAIASSLHRRGLGFSYMVSVGNETVFDTLDALSWVIEQNDVRVVAVYIEGLKDAQRILPIARRARQRGVRIVMLKAGRSELGQQTTASHTGKIASPHNIYADVLRQAGVISLNNLGELMAAVEVLAFMQYPRKGQGNLSGVSMLSSSGGAAALLADHSSETSIPLTSFNADTARRLEQLLPEFARKDNPIDLTGQINTIPNLFRDTCLTIVDDPRTEALVIQHANSGRRYLKSDGEIYKKLAQQLPVIISFVGDDLDPATRKEFRDAGVLLSPEPSATMQALSLLYKLRDHQEYAVLDIPKKSLPAPHDWEEIMAFCSLAGARPAKWTLLSASQTATSACANLNYPVVVKALPSDAEHKSELGLVKLNVKTAGQVDSLAAEFRQRMSKPNADILIQEMISEPGIEVIVSCLRNTDFGPIISIGTGGVAVELYRDITHLALPTSEEHVRDALQRLSLWTLLQGFRGQHAADIDALVDMTVQIGQQFLASPEIQELELNPVIVHAKGKGLHIVDALLVCNHCVDTIPEAVHA